MVIADSGFALSASLGVSPNPSTGAANIQFSLGQSQSFTLSVYDLRGRRVRVLEQGIGSDQSSIVGWDGRDGQGRNVPSGIYFVRLRSGDDVLTSKVVLSR